MRLFLGHPHLARRSCDTCRAWVFEDKPGEFAERPAQRAGRDVPRVTAFTPCSYCPKQPADVPEADRSPATAVELSDKNWRAYWHYCEAEAVRDSRDADDPIVRRNAVVIAQIRRDAEAVHQIRLHTLGLRKT